MSSLQHKNHQDKKSERLQNNMPRIYETAGNLIRDNMLDLCLLSQKDHAK